MASDRTQGSSHSGLAFFASFFGFCLGTTVAIMLDQAWFETPDNGATPPGAGLVQAIGAAHAAVADAAVCPRRRFGSGCILE